MIRRFVPAAMLGLLQGLRGVAANPSGKCNHDHQCPSGQVCHSNQCVVPGATPDPIVIPGPTVVLPGQTIVVPGVSGSVTCQTGETPLQCCRRSVKRACKSEGGDCRKRGKKTCQKTFG